MAADDVAGADEAVYWGAAAAVVAADTAYWVVVPVRVVKVTTDDAVNAATEADVEAVCAYVLAIFVVNATVLADIAATAADYYAKSANRS